MTTLPAPTKTVRKRSVAYRFVTKVDGSAEKGVDIRVTQFEGRKVALAYASVSVVEREDGYDTVTFEPFTGVSLGTRAMGRFSQKRLEEFADDVLRAVPTLVLDNEKFAAMFDPDWEAPR